MMSQLMRMIRRLISLRSSREIVEAASDKEDHFAVLWITENYRDRDQTNRFTGMLR
jgi:hypothetical protein